MEPFASRLRELREKKGMSRQVLADLCGISRSAMRRFERGERIPNLETACAISDALGVSLDYLAGKK